MNSQLIAPFRLANSRPVKINGLDCMTRLVTVMSGTQSPLLHGDARQHPNCDCLKCLDCWRSVCPNDPSNREVYRHLFTLSFPITKCSTLTKQNKKMTAYPVCSLVRSCQIFCSAKTTKESILADIGWFFPMSATHAKYGAFLSRE